MMMMMMMMMYYGFHFIFKILKYSDHEQSYVNILHVISIT